MNRRNRQRNQQQKQNNKARRLLNDCLAEARRLKHMGLDRGDASVQLKRKFGRKSSNQRALAIHMVYDGD